MPPSPDLTALLLRAARTARREAEALKQEAIALRDPGIGVAAAMRSLTWAMLEDIANGKLAVEEPMPARMRVEIEALLTPRTCAACAGPMPEEPDARWYSASQRGIPTGSTFDTTLQNRDRNGRFRFACAPACADALRRAVAGRAN